MSNFMLYFVKLFIFLFFLSLIKACNIETVESNLLRIQYDSCSPFSIKIGAFDQPPSQFYFELKIVALGGVRYENNQITSCPTCNILNSITDITDSVASFNSDQCLKYVQGKFKTQVTGPTTFVQFQSFLTKNHVYYNVAPYFPTYNSISSTPICVVEPQIMSTDCPPSSTPCYYCNSTCGPMLHAGIGAFKFGYGVHNWNFAEEATHLRLRFEFVPIQFTLEYYFNDDPTLTTFASMSNIQFESVTFIRRVVGKPPYYVRWAWPSTFVGQNGYDEGTRFFGQAKRTIGIENDNIFLNIDIPKDDLESPGSRLFYDPDITIANASTFSICSTLLILCIIMYIIF